MTAPTLFDFTTGTVSRLHPSDVRAVIARARNTDPETAHRAAETMRPASRELVAAIRWFVVRQREPKTAFEIADAIYGQRWSHATVRTAVSRSSLTEFDKTGRSPRGQACLRYVLKEEA